MTINKGDYLLWFAHYKSLVFERMEDVAEAIDLVLLLDDCDTSTFDQHGCVLDLERVGYGIVSDFDQQCEDARKKREAEWAAERARIQRKREANPEPSGPRYRIRLKGPDGVGKGLYSHGEYIAHDLDSEAVIVERDRLEAIFGTARIKVEASR